MNPRNPSDGHDETRYLGPVGGPGGSGGDRPRQYFPGESDPNYRYQEPQYQQPAYQEPYRPPEEKKSRGALPMLLGILFGLTLLAAVAFFFLWRNAAAEADREPPAPVTVTSTVSQTLTETVTREAPRLPTEIPTEIPSDILPSGVPGIDLDGLLERFTGGGEPTPAQ
ncbi:hypothetical protein [Corynebacterium comes]|uniref:Uncharacterized protein n=1 Tax=Corynebacterium comes TaxID=2675218 RepID=A0A6B8VYB6_9CORY|nr:hypothetical protein [Corynebacterium comes]QGU03696.1 hypothetical protein CETAM_02060 [Corynebacterium comes]